MVEDDRTVMGALLRKELREQRRILWVFTLLFGMGIALELATEVPDQRTLDRTFDVFIDGGAWGAFVGFLISIWVANELFIREIDEGTLGFYDSLPASRDALFGVKMLVIFIIYQLFALASVGFGFALHWLSATSLDAHGYPGILLPYLALNGLGVLIILPMAILLSFLRSLAWLVALLISLVWALIGALWPSLGWLNLFAVFEPTFEGSRRIIPAEVWGWSLFGALCLVGSWLLFRGGMDRIAALMEKVPGIVRGGLWTVGMGVLLTGVYDLADREDFEFDEAYFADGTISTSSSRHYAFSYPTHLAARAEELQRAADPIHEQVREFLGAEAGNRITVDLSGAARGTEGVSFARTIRVDLPSHSDIEELTAIFGHETVHVFINRLTRERVASASGFFEEGLSSYIEHRFFRAAGSLEGFRIVAGAMRDRLNLTFNEITDTDELARQFDEHLVYILSEIFFSAVVERYGDAAPGLILTRIGRPDHDDSPSGVELWRDGFQAAGFNFDQTVADFYRILMHEEKTHAEIIRRLPRLRADFRVEDELYRIEPIYEGEVEEGWNVNCRVRISPEFSLGDLEWLYPDEEGVFWVERDDWGGTFEVQLGLVNDELNAGVWERWIEPALDEDS